MNVKSILLFFALTSSACFAHADDIAKVRPSAEVMPGLVVTADAISVNRSAATAGDLTFTGDVSVSDGSNMTFGPWAAFSQSSQILSIAGSQVVDLSRSMCGGSNCCKNGGFYVQANGSEVLVGYPTKANPYRGAFSGGRGLYCVGDVIAYTP